VVGCAAIGVVEVAGPSIDGDEIDDVDAKEVEEDTKLEVDADVDTVIGTPSIEIPESDDVEVNDVDVIPRPSDSLLGTGEVADQIPISVELLFVKEMLLGPLPSD
jgi:hypothetical protein